MKKTNSLIWWIALFLTTIPCAVAQDVEEILLNFSGGGVDQPTAGLISDAKGNLYGVTGNYGVDCSSNCGRVFEMSPTDKGWSVSTLHVFRGGNDGSAPQASLTMDGAGNLYGTTASGGGTCTLQTGGCGTVFKLTRDSSGHWSETILHSFTNTADGALPFSSVIFDSIGNLYGGTNFSGLVSSACLQGCGTVFKLTPSGNSWSFSVIHTFTGGTDGAFGGDIIFDASGALYGTTGGGGMTNSLCSRGCGTVFKMTPDGHGWIKNTIYGFSGSGDGFAPFSLILDAEGNLYGAALFGGNLRCVPNGCGTIFELSPSGSSWTFSMIHSFSGPDGANPAGIVLDEFGNLYGTSEFLGTSCCGNIYELVPAGDGWKQNVLYSFTDQGAGGFYPVGTPLPGATGNLFGVAHNGGTGESGVAFELVP